MNWINKLTLEGKYTTLIPLEIDHQQGLLAAAADGELWKLWYTSVPSEETIEDYISDALEQRKNGTQYPFTVIEKSSNKIIGSTRFYNLQPNHRRLEIGFTWYAASAQRTHVNSECKLLLLSYAFEELNCIAVQFMTNWHNQKSRTAIARLGARQDGVLRNHRIQPDGSYSDTVVFSIAEHEWNGVKKTLIQKLNQ